MARGADGQLMDVSVVTLNDTWRAVLLFGAAAGFIAHAVAPPST